MMSPLRIGALLFLVVICFWRHSPRWLRRAYIAIGFAVFVLTTPFGANSLVRLQEARATPVPSCAHDAPDAIVALSGGTSYPPIGASDYSALSASSLRRAFGAVALSTEHPTSQLVFVGGLGHYDVAESTLMMNLARTMGVDPSLIRTETASQTTWQNALFTRALDPPLPTRIWLVTSALHMPRALYAFREAGFDPCPWPVDRLKRGHPDWGYFLPYGGAAEKSEDAIHEIVGEIAYRAGIGRGLDRESSNEGE